MAGHGLPAPRRGLEVAPPLPAELRPPRLYGKGAVLCPGAHRVLGHCAVGDPSVPRQPSLEPPLELRLQLLVRVPFGCALVDGRCAHSLRRLVGDRELRVRCTRIPRGGEQPLALVARSGELVWLDAVRGASERRRNAHRLEQWGSGSELCADGSGKGASLGHFGRWRCWGGRGSAELRCERRLAGSDERLYDKWRGRWRQQQQRRRRQR
mmetsp:Transcript_39298/g.106136  ORF Transcript_39298/g.106136 Transcript_39298/m.106136 type:complete len:210 (-) Transcript_39298:34-663(-)